MFFRAHGDIDGKNPTQYGMGAMEFAGRNRIINGDFSVNQRGFTSTMTDGVFGFDRWNLWLIGGTVTYSSQTPALGDLPESAKAYARIVTSGQASATDYAMLVQKVESVRTLSGKTATISFWARAGSGTPKVAVTLGQMFGQTGSPSATVNTHAGNVTLSTLWTRYSVTVAVPSIAGKTLGTLGNDTLRVMLIVSSGASASIPSGSLGIQNNTFDFWGVQVEEGPYATAYEQKPYAQELRDCQRYFQRWTQPPFRGMVAGAAVVGRMTMPLSVTMRAAPTGSYSGTINLYDGVSATTLSSVSTWYNTPSSVEWDGTTPSVFTSAGNACGVYQYGTGYFDFSAEL